METNEEQEQREKLLEILRNLTIKDIWDKFVSIRTSNGAMEWYAEWPENRDPLLACLAATTPAPEETSSSTSATPLQILIPVCGTSGLSEQLYDAGFHCITNIDFSKAVISEMLTRNVRSRPEMKWRVMDMTEMTFVGETFDVVLEKGGLDALMDPLLGPKFGNDYLAEVKRVLRKGGKFICLTLGEFRVLGILFPKFRYGWRVSVHCLPLKPSNEPSIYTFMVIAEKESSSNLHMLSLSFDPTSLPSEWDQVRELSQALETENRVRVEFSNCSDILYTLEDLRLGAKGDLNHYSPGLRIQISMGEEGNSLFVYRAILLDSPQRSDSDPFLHDFGVFLVQKTRGHEWIFSSEEGQWTVVMGLKAARLIMVFLDSSHNEVSMEKIQEDLNPLLNQLEPWKYASRAEMGPLMLPYWGLGGGIKECKLVHQVTSSLIGQIIIEEVVRENVDDDFLRPSKDLLFRRLTFLRSQSSVQSEALLKREERKKTHPSKAKKRGKGKKKESHASQTDGIHDSSYGLKVDHDYLASHYHAGMISGLVLISSYLERMASPGQSVTANIIGLGAGLLPMFLHGCLPFGHIMVVELDPVVCDLARDFFDFKEDERLKVHVADDILIGREAIKSKPPAETTTSCENEDAVCSAGGPSVSCESPSEPIQVGDGSHKVDIFIVDADSFDSSSGLACPAAAFVEESFFLAVKDSISEEGLFIMHLLSRTAAIRALVISRMKTVFRNLYVLDTKSDDHEVIFALNTEVATVVNLAEASKKLKKILKLNNPIIRKLILDGINNMETVN